MLGSTWKKSSYISNLQKILDEDKQKLYLSIKYFELYQQINIVVPFHKTTQTWINLKDFLLS